MTRQAVLDELAAELCARDVGHPLRVGVDGVCGVGKTTFAGDLADALHACGRPVVRLDSDRFHQPRAIRYRQGRDSARGYLEDAYDFDSLRDLTLAPLGGPPPHRFASGVHDLQTDETRHTWETAAPDAIVVFDATFLQRTDLRPHWDEVVFLDADPSSAQARAVARDAAAMGGAQSAVAAYESRYMAACRIYLEETDPRSLASIVVGHDDPANAVRMR